MNKHTALLLPLCLLSACQSLPALEGRSVSHYVDAATAPRLESALRPAEAERQDSGIYLLDDAHDAFVARATLIESADHALDIQYYIWHNDVSGNLLFNMLYRAADRGVRVRLLLDDNNTNGMDNILAALNHHANIEIRLFNPFMNRKWRALGYLTDFPRLNRRMHNKSLTADNRATIVGGRNIGDEYFNVSGDTVFADMDVLATGKIVGEVSQDFDRYWASESAYPLERVIPKADVAKGMAELNAGGRQNGAVLQRYHQDLAQSHLLEAIKNNNVPWQPAHTRLISDDPAKGLDRDRHKPAIGAKLSQALMPEQEIYLVSPYFVPTQSGTEALADMAQQGIKVTVLTNSLQATDVAAVHSGYSKYRKPLLQAGITLYELKPGSAVPKGRDRGLTGSSSTSLHAKTFVVDRARVFVGSFNLDPRSARLNTEMGVLIDSPEIAGEIQRSLVEATPQHAYQVTLNQQQKLQWQDPQSGETHQKEPEAGFWKRLTVKLLSVLPIEGLL